MASIGAIMVPGNIHPPEAKKWTITPRKETRNKTG
jgi:hypothetical protein